MKCLLGQNRLELQQLAFAYLRQAVLQLVVFLVLLVLALFVHGQEAVELGHRTRRAQQVVRAVAALGIHFDGRLVEDGRRHLGRDKPHPDDAVQLQFVFAQVLCDLIRSVMNRGRPDGFVRILRLLLGLVDVRRRRQVLLAVALADERAYLFKGVVGDARRIRTHVGDQTH